MENNTANTLLLRFSLTDDGKAKLNVSASKETDETRALDGLLELLDALDRADAKNLRTEIVNACGRAGIHIPPAS